MKASVVEIYKDYCIVLTGTEGSSGRICLPEHMRSVMK